MKVFCTIITQSHLAYVQALYHSLVQFNRSIRFHVLIVDLSEIIDVEFEILSLNEVIKGDKLGQKINDKYNHPDTIDQLRWSLKPILINYFFKNGFEKVIFTDPDTYYFSDYQFLFNELDENNVLLTPHWRGMTPLNNRDNFNLQFVGGLFNAGFIAVNNKAIDIMEWWAQMCLYKCEKDFEHGLYVDQTYLNLMPIYFEKVKVLKHKGCNVANWNQVECSRQEIDGSILIEGKWEIVFIHFTTSTIRGIVMQEDKNLRPYLDDYLKVLRTNGFKIDIETFKPQKETDYPRSKYWHAKNWIHKRIKF